jgi:superfamily II DNA or RNA helicase
VKEYDQKYSTSIRGGESLFRQVDREESLVQLMRVNLLKRMESSVVAFSLTLERQLKDVDFLLNRIDNQEESIEELSLEEIDFDDPALEPMMVGTKVKVLLKDVDLIRWRQDLALDRNRLNTLLAAARQITPERDAKLKALKETIRAKIDGPINEGNKKVLIFSASADTVNYLYQQISFWALDGFGIHTAQVTGTGSIKTTMPKLHNGLVNVLTAFSPHAKERPESLKDDGEIDILIATDCISEGQNLQDCDYLINYDIHWNPVRIIQRFGRIDRLGSPNTSIQLVNFWPNMELEEYINLEQRVSGKMVLLDISATGEENLIEHQSGNQMNDLEYRRKQLLKLQESVIDMEDISAGISITDLTLNDFRVDLTGFLASHPETLERLHLGSFSVTTNAGHSPEDMPPGVIFLLRSEKEVAGQESSHPLAPHYLVHVGENGAVLLPYTATKKILDRLKRATMGRDLPNADACARFDKQTRHGEDTRKLQDQLAEAIRSIVGKTEERAVASLFNPEGTHALQGEFHGSGDFEVVAYVVILPEGS